MVFTSENLFLLGFCFFQHGDTALEHLSSLLKGFLWDILRHTILSRLRQIDDCFGVSHGGVFIRFEIFTGGTERFDEQVFCFDVELLQDTSIAGSQ